MNIERTPIAQQDFDETTSLDPIAQFAKDVEAAARLGMLKLSFEQRGIGYEEGVDGRGRTYLLSDKHMHFGPQV